MSNSNKQDNLVNTAGNQTQVNQTQNLKNSPSVLKNALKMAFGTMTSRVLGVLRESLLAALFDKQITDAWSAAFRIPNLFRRLLGEGSLSVSLIPVFVQAHSESKERAQNLVNSMYCLLLILLSVLTTIGYLYPHVFLNFVLSPEYIADVEKMALTVHMAQIMFLFVFFISSFAFFMGILNSLGQFFWPAMAPTFWNIAMVVSTLWPASWLSETSRQYGDQLAWGVVIGGFLQATILIPSLIKSGFLPIPKLDLRNKDMWLVLRNMVPGFIGTGLLQFMTIINLRFSSSFAEGTISYINYVDRLIELPLSLISVSLGSALLPVLSLSWTQNKKNEFVQTSRKYLELNLLVSMAAACGLFILAEPVVQLLFGRGKFQTTDVLQAALILKSYCWIMIFVSGVRVLTPAYYAVKNTWYPMVVSAVSLLVHLFLAPRLMSQWGISGLMYSTTISAAVNMGLLLLSYNRLIANFEFLKFTIQILKMLMVSALVAGLALVFQSELSNYAELSFAILAIKVALAIFSCGAVFLVSSYFLGFAEVQTMMQRLLKKMRLKK